MTGLELEQFEREQEAAQRLADKRTAAQANLEFGPNEANEGRFVSSLSFFQQGERACTDEPRLISEREALARRSRQVSQLVEFEKFSNEAIVAILFE